MAVVGLGASGLAAARLCRRAGAMVTGFDQAARDLLSPDAREFLSGDVHTTAAGTLDRFDLIVVSPGVPENPALSSAAQHGVEIIGELELGARALPPSLPLILVGGTNGKSTVTALTAALFAAAGHRTFVGGNFGTPLSEAVGDELDVAVVEISSFQAERLPTLHARGHALLNVTPDHLDRYASFADYAHAKGNPFAQMDDRDIAVVPLADEACAQQARRGAARLVTFGIHDADVAPDGAGAILDRLRDHRYSLDELALQGGHNVANVCAAIALVSGLAVAGVLDTSASAIARALREFRGLPHRNVLVRELDQVRYYDDSKGTNVGATVAALLGLVEPRAVLIAGGRDKLGSYEPLVVALRQRGRALVLIGEAADRIASAASGVVPIARARSMAEAVSIGRELAHPGDAVMLSPACSSYDMFRDYKERGDIFVHAVLALEGIA
ncbi:MAG: UDP-N-acetylmuramoyl-L-alanine--D-glutamate ligase [Myxococcales bacterium]|nr:UDP-N-acetylmuramoyl-L-alanine--D-glutamate ligase [Myxococcales bacterium]